MFAMALLWLWGADPAHAASEIQLRSSLPVVMVVNGERARRTGMSRMEVDDLEPGVHRVQIKNLFGRVLHDDFIDVPDDTLVEAWWNRGELRVRMVPLSRRGARSALAPEPQAEEALPDDVPEEVAPSAPEEGVPDPAPAVVPVPAVAPALNEPSDLTEQAMEVMVVEEGAAEEREEVDLLDVPDAEEVVETPDDVPDGALAEAAEEGDPEDEPVEASEEDELLVDLASMTAITPPPAAAPEASIVGEEAGTAPPVQRLRLELQDGTQLELVHGETVLRVEIREGQVVLTEVPTQDPADVTAE